MRLAHDRDIREHEGLGYEGDIKFDNVVGHRSALSGTSPGRCSRCRGAISHGLENNKHIKSVSRTRKHGEKVL